MILSEDSIIVFMFLNMGSSTNQLVGNVNGYNIMLYGHVVNDRYPERLEKVQKVSGAKFLKFNNLLKKSISITKEHYKECLNPTKEKVRHVIRDEIHFQCEDGNHYIIDLTMLVTGTMVSYSPDAPKEIMPQYKDLVNKRIIKENDKILSFETLATTIRLAGESLENFSKQPVVANFGFPKRMYKATKQDIIDMSAHMMINQNTMIGKKALKLINQYKRVTQ